MSKLFAPRYLPELADPHALAEHPPPRAASPLGVLLINLGTPDEPTPAAIRRYLREFLSDPRVIEIPPLLWQPILRTMVLARRPRTLVPRYRDIWLDDGSPLLVYSQAQATGLQQRLRARGIKACVALGMRYGNPSIDSAMNELQQAGCEHVLAVPMYPQYAASTTATAVDAVARNLARRRNQPAFRTIKRHHADAGYIDALWRQLTRYWDNHGMPDRLLLSYHGLPRSVVEKGDAYYRDCMETTSLIRQRMGDEGDRVHASFQSRFGAQEWLQPYTEPTLRQWGREGVGRVDVMCPGFVADCLETLEEIQVECRDAFLEEGGRELRYIACLNDNPDWLDALTDLVVTNLVGWPGADTV